MECWPQSLKECCLKQRVEDPGNAGEEEDVGITSPSQKGSQNRCKPCRVMGTHMHSSSSPALRALGERGGQNFCFMGGREGSQLKMGSEEVLCLLPTLSSCDMGHQGSGSSFLWDIVFYYFALLLQLHLNSLNVRACLAFLGSALLMLGLMVVVLKSYDYGAQELVRPFHSTVEGVKPR